MNSAELPTSDPSLFAEASPWGDVRRIYRRICVLRAQGKIEDAAMLENAEFSRALAAARLCAPDSVDEAALLSREAERVAHATVLAELMAPLLAEHLREPAFARPSPSAPTTDARSESGPAPAHPNPPAAPGVPQIADLIDGMLSQENAFAPRARS